MNIIVFGDSISWGAFDKEHGGWVERLKCFLFKYECLVYNCSISGDTSASLLNRFTGELCARNLDPENTGVIIAIGANDSGYDNEGKMVSTPEGYLVNIDELYTRAKKITDNILFVGLTPIDDKKTNPVHWDENLNYSHEKTLKYDKLLRGYCERRSIQFVGLSDLDKEYLTDGCHPDDNMHLQIFNRVKEEIADWYK